MKKFIEGLDGTLIQDTSYVGEDAWEDDQDSPQENMKQIIDKDVRLKAELKKDLKQDLGILGELVILLVLDKHRHDRCSRFI